VRYSRQRNLILDIVRSTDTHPTADWIYRKAKLTMPSIGIATVYRDLSMLANAGDIKKISVSGAEDRFDRDTSEHSHFRCRECGALIDLKPISQKAYDELRDMVKMTFDVSDDDVVLGETLLTGTCERCRREAAGRS
jgi:Fe2+ or Zn2+ uptake regulation protein